MIDGNRWSPAWQNEIGPLPTAARKRFWKPKRLPSQTFCERLLQFSR
jgi:hypothetical protein